jgi:hypothetical protein
MMPPACRNDQGNRAPGDYVVLLGAGNITQWAYALPRSELAARGKDVIGRHSFPPESEAARSCARLRRTNRSPR